MNAAAFNQKHYGSVIKEARLKNGMLQAQLARKLGVSPNMIGHWENGRARPDLNLIPLLCRTLGITYEIFFAGKPGWNDLSPEEQHILSLYRALSEADRTVLSYSLEKAKELRHEELRNRCLTAYRRIFLNDQAAAAGTAATLGEAAGEAVYVRINRMSSRAREIIKVNGDSMFPMFEHGQLVYVEEASGLKPGEIGVFTVNGEGYIKEYQGDRLHSINPEYKDIMLSEEDDLRCFGRVLGIAEEDDFPTEEELCVLSEISAESRGERY